MTILIIKCYIGNIRDTLKHFNFEVEKCVTLLHQNLNITYFRAGRDCYDRYDTGVVGGVTTGTALNQNQTLELDHKLCSSNSRDNVDYLKVVRHEFLHVFGLMHTQTRWDRNNYVWVDTSNIEDTKEARYQYEICMDCKTFDAPYECNSIMHYKANTYAKNPNKDVMYSKVCKINPGNTLTDWDWKLLNKAAKCPGS